MRRWNGEVVATDSRKKIDFTPELLREIGASGKTLSAIAKELKCSRQLISKHINKSLTNRLAYQEGKLKTNGKRT